MIAMHKPVQLIKFCWGIKPPAPGRAPIAFPGNDLTVHPMDAPELLPSGSCRQDSANPDHDPDTHESFCYREPIGPAGRNF